MDYSEMMEEIKQKFKAWGGIESCDLDLKKVIGIAEEGEKIARIQPGLCAIIRQTGVHAIVPGAFYFHESDNALKAFKSLTFEQIKFWGSLKH